MNELKFGKNFVSKNIESYIKTALVFIIIYASFRIFKPFLIPFVWGVIIAIALYPLHKWLTKKLKNKSNLSATIITLVLLTLLLAPSISFTGSLVDSIKELKAGAKEGALLVPAPPDNVAEWPVVGKKIHGMWKVFSESTAMGIEKYGEQLKEVGQKFISFLSGFAGSILIFIISIIIAGIFLAKSSGGYKSVYTLSTALLGEKGNEVVDNLKATVSSVVNGILGTAIAQTTIIAIALFVFHVPGAAIITLIVLFFAVAQLPTIIIILPVVIYMFSILPPTQAIIFTIWAITGAISDNFIKPMLLGRGLDIPMLVILIGAIGGMVVMGIVGLFIGAVVLALGYQLFHMWIDDTQEVLDEGK